MPRLKPFCKIYFCLASSFGAHCEIYVSSAIKKCRIFRSKNVVKICKFFLFFLNQVGSGEVFSITEDTAELLKDDLPNPADANDDDDEWQDVEESEEWGPQTPMTPLNDDSGKGPFNC